MRVVKRIVVLDDPVPHDRRAFDDFVTVREQDGALLEELGAPVDYDANDAYAGAAEVPRWVIEVYDLFLERSHAQLVMRRCHDEEWVKALLSVLELGGRKAARRFALARVLPHA